MSKFRRFQMWAAMVLIVLLMGLSVFSAFYGTQRSQDFFNSLPLTVYWSLFGVVLIVAIASFRRLLRVPALLLTHLGCVFLLAGGMWGSPGGHDLQKKFFGSEKVPFGHMVIYETESVNAIVDLDRDGKILAELPFSVYLDDFRMEYYSEPSYLDIESDDARWRLAAEVGAGRAAGQIRIEIVRVFRNFKIGIADGERTVTDSDGPGSNPAVEIIVTTPDGSQQSKYIFEAFPDTTYSENGLRFSYASGRGGAVRDYYSDLVVYEGDKEVARKSIEVNHPLYYGGYHFYQNSYDPEYGAYTVLTVYSDSGLWLVYAAYVMITLAVMWQFWIRHIIRHFRRQPDGD